MNLSFFQDLHKEDLSVYTETVTRKGWTQDSCREFQTDLAIKLNGEASSVFKTKSDAESINPEFQNLKRVSDNEFITDFKSLAVRHRKLESETVLYISEVRRRRLDLKKGYSSLFDFLVNHIGLSRGTAQRGIDAAKLSQDVPEVINHIQDGSLTLSQVTVVQKSFRELKKSSPQQSISKELKQELIQEITNKSTEESQVIISQRLDLEIKQVPKIRYQKDESVRLEITLTKQQWQKLNKMRELLSNSVPSGTWDEVLEYISDKVIKQKDKTRMIEKVSKKEGRAINESMHTKEKASKTESRPIYQKTSKKEIGHIEEKSSKEELNSLSREINNQPARAHIPNSIQRQIYNRDRCCQHLDQTTGKKCESRWQLNIDHIKPIWAGGDNSIQNLRILCRSHNRYRYQEQFNLRRLN